MEVHEKLFSEYFVAWLLPNWNTGNMHKRGFYTIFPVSTIFVFSTNLNYLKDKITRNVSIKTITRIERRLLRQCPER